MSDVRCGRCGGDYEVCEHRWDDDLSVTLKPDVGVTWGPADILARLEALEAQVRELQQFRVDLADGLMYEPRLPKPPTDTVDNAPRG